MTTDREVMQQALEALVTHGCAYLHHAEEYGAAIVALRARLAEPETCKPALQVEEVEPVAWMLALPDGRLERLSVFGRDYEAKEMLARSCAGCTMVPLYTAPHARRPLTDEEIDKLPWCPSYENPMTLAEGLRYFARAIERAHKIGGNDE
jgi:hypothetical protein